MGDFHGFHVLSHFISEWNFISVSLRTTGTIFSSTYNRNRNSGAEPVAFARRDAHPVLGTPGGPRIFRLETPEDGACSVFQNNTWVCAPRRY